MTDPFARHVASYDAWYDTAPGRAVFAEERAALYPLLATLPHPWLEVGVGTGRFAESLGAECGIDPSAPALAFATHRQVRVALARGEALPFRSHIFGAVLMVTTLCFVANPPAALRELRRVLRPDGGLVLGVVPADGPWGEHYQLLAAQGHAYYQHASFLSRAALASHLCAAGLQPRRTRAALRWPPDGIPRSSRSPSEGDDRQAGFLGLLAAPRARPAGRVGREQHGHLHRPVVAARAGPPAQSGQQCPGHGPWVARDGPGEGEEATRWQPG